MPLPPVEMTSILLMRFAPGVPSDVVGLIKERLASGGIATVTEEGEGRAQEEKKGGGGGKGQGTEAVVLGLTTTQEELEAEAETVRLMKPLLNRRSRRADRKGGGSGAGGDGDEGETMIMEYFSAESRSQFAIAELPPSPSSPTQNDTKGADKNDKCEKNGSSGRGSIFGSNSSLPRLRKSPRSVAETEETLQAPVKDFEEKPKPLPPPPPPVNDQTNGGNDNNPDLDQYGLFTSAERAMLLWSMLDSVTVLDQGSKGSELSRRIEEMRAASRSRSRSASLLASLPATAATQKEKKEEEPREAEAVDAERLARKCLWLSLRQNGIIDLVAPAHDPKRRDRILAGTLLPLRVVPPVASIRSYYGEEVAFYFAWMGHFTLWLLVPAFGGILSVYARGVWGDEEDSCRFAALYGLVTPLWAVVAVRFWDREECRLAYEWGTHSSTGYEKERMHNARPEFRGTPRISPVSGTVEMYYPPYKRRLKYIGSAMITCILLAGAFFVMILSLNLQGYVHPNHDPERWYEDHHHPFHYPFFATLAEERSIFDAASQWRCYIPVLLHVGVVTAMNAGYRSVAERLTRWENHETEVSHDNSLILKRFLFEAFDAYVVLFYLAFYERDVGKLRGELVSLFNVDVFRRMFTECVLPMAMQWHNHYTRSRDSQKESAKKKKSDEASDPPSCNPLTEEAERDMYEEFDDYLEMIIQLGYVTLFASAYPLAASVAVFANLVEVRTDATKLARVCLRPRPLRTDGIGTWKLLLKSIAWLGVLTNCILFGFSSTQLMRFLPDHFYLDEFGKHKTVDGKGNRVCFLVFGIEHALLLVALLINLVVPKVPEDVLVNEQRRQFLRLQSAKEMRVTETVKKQRSLGLKKFRKAMGFKAKKSSVKK